MKIGTVISIFEPGWEKKYARLCESKADHFELLIEDGISLTGIKAFCENRSVLLHAPFLDLNLISHYQQLRDASLEITIQKLSPLVTAFQPEVITLHCGYMYRYYTDLQFTAIQKLVDLFPSIAIENLPPAQSFLRQPYPSTPEDINTIMSVVSRMTFDVGHSLKNGDDIYSLLHTYKDYIVNIHLHDVVNGSDHKALGTGELNLKKFFQTLKQIKYQHYVTVELDAENINGMISSLELISEYKD